MRKQAEYLTFEESKVKLNLDAAIFITMNPSSKYAGRVDLPVNLKNLFRSVQMVVPDKYFICEILLYSCGFVNATEVSKKICNVQAMS